MMGPSHCSSPDSSSLFLHPAPEAGPSQNYVIPDTLQKTLQCPFLYSRCQENQCLWPEIQLCQEHCSSIFTYSALIQSEKPGLWDRAGKSNTLFHYFLETFWKKLRLLRLLCWGCWWGSETSSETDLLPVSSINVFRISFSLFGLGPAWPFRISELIL